MEGEYQKTFVMIKPDGVRRRLVGEIIKRFENRGLILEELRLERLSREKAEAQYAVHRGKDFFEGLISYVTSGPVVVMRLSGPQVVRVVREMVGATNPIEAKPGTIRGDFALEISENIIHASDSEATAQQEIGLFFPESKVKSKLEQ